MNPLLRNKQHLRSVVQTFYFRVWKERNKCFSAIPRSQKLTMLTIPEGKGRPVIVSRFSPWWNRVQCEQQNQRRHINISHFNSSHHHHHCRRRRLQLKEIIVVLFSFPNETLFVHSSNYMSSTCLLSRLDILPFHSVPSTWLHHWFVTSEILSVITLYTMK